MSKVLREFINPHWAGVPYRNQADIDRQWFGSSGVSQGNGSCVSHGLASAAYALFGERAAPCGGAFGRMG